MAKLRPAKVRSAVRRRYFEARLGALAIPPAPAGSVQRDLGTPYGGWLIPTANITPEWVCYCVGIGADTSFDRALIENWGVSVRAFDASQEYADLATAELLAEPRFSAHHAAITTTDGPIRLQRTHDPQSASLSAAGLYDTDEHSVQVPGRSLSSLMAQFGDTRIDLLKLDIEGAEYELLAELDLRDLGVQTFAVQLHHVASVADARRLIARLDEHGYSLVARRPAVKLCFARR